MLFSVDLSETLISYAMACPICLGSECNPQPLEPCGHRVCGPGLDGWKRRRCPVCTVPFTKSASSIFEDTDDPAAAEADALVYDAEYSRNAADEATRDYLRVDPDAQLQMRAPISAFLEMRAEPVLPVVEAEAQQQPVLVQAPMIFSAPLLPIRGDDDVETISSGSPAATEIETDEEHELPDDVAGAQNIEEISGLVDSGFIDGNMLAEDAAVTASLSSNRMNPY